MADRLSKVASLLNATCGYYWEGRAQLLRTGVIALVHDLGDAATGDEIENQVDPLRLMLCDQEAALDTVTQWIEARCTVNPSVSAIPDALVTDCREWAQRQGFDPPTATTIRRVLAAAYAIQWRVDKLTGNTAYGIALKRGRPSKAA